MKFTNGYWLTKPEYRMLYATQCVRAEQRGEELVILSSGVPVSQRGDVLTRRTTSPTALFCPVETRDQLLCSVSALHGSLHTMRKRRMRADLQLPGLDLFGGFIQCAIAFMP